MSRNHLSLVPPSRTCRPAPDVPPVDALPPAEMLQREPYVAGWMIEEGNRAFRARRGDRHLRWILAAGVAAIALAAVLAATA